MAAWARPKPSKARRLEEIAGVLAAYGFDVLFHRGRFWRRKRHGRIQKLTPPERLRLLLEELGPTYIKLGQAISTRPDLVPAEYAIELRKLQDEAPAESYEVIAGVFEEELGVTPDQAFASFEREPRAAASLSQVHNAVLPDGTLVAVKIQRPDIRNRIEADFLVIEDVAKHLSHHFEVARTLDLEGWLSEFEFSLRQQLDFRREARNVERFQEDLASEEGVYIPGVYEDWSTSRVLTLDRVDGFKVTEPAALRAAGIDPKKVAQTCSRVTLRMVHEYGFFHADPHAGNFFVLPDGRVAIIDFGMVGTLDRRLNDTILLISLLLAQGDAERLTDEIISFAEIDGEVDRTALRRSIGRLLDQHFADGPRHLPSHRGRESPCPESTCEDKASGPRTGLRRSIRRAPGYSQSSSFAFLLFDLIKVAGEQSIRMPSSIALLARTYVMAEGIGKALDPDFDLEQNVQPYVRKLFFKRYSPVGWAKQMEEDAPMLAYLAGSLPSRADRLLIQLEKGQISFVTRIHDLDHILKHVHMAAHRISMSMLAAGIIGGLAVLALILEPHGFQGWTGILLGVLVLAIVFVAVSFLVTTWKSWRDI